MPSTLSSSSDLSSIRGETSPRIGTARTGRETLGREALELAVLAGLDPRPFQELILDRALEIKSDGSWAYETIGIEIARQNGKTGVLKMRILAGLYLFDDGLILHTAADRALPRAVFAEVVDMIETTPFLSRQVKKIRLSNGTEEVLLRNGNSYRILAPEQKAWRGWSAGLLLFDEVREQRDDALWSAGLYTQRAQPNPQRWSVSNAGDPGSIVLRKIHDRGRAAVDAPTQDPSICYLEWSTPDEYAIDDPEGWKYANPELGRSLRPESLLEELRSDDPIRFETEALCRWSQTTTLHAVPLDGWARAARPDLDDLAPNPNVRTLFAIDIDPGRTDAALVVAQVPDEGPIRVTIGESWTDPNGVDEIKISDTLETWIDLYRPEAIGFDPYTTSTLAERLQHYATWEPIRGVRYVASCLALWDAVANDHLVHYGDPELDLQIAYAGRKDVGDGAFTIARIRSEIPIPAVVSLARVMALSVQVKQTAEIL